VPEILLLAILFGSYFLPWIIAIVRDHPSREAICFVNLLFGWTVVGWFASLAWAVTGEARSR
jgi:hypothetical protein